VGDRGDPDVCAVLHELNADIHSADREGKHAERQARGHDDDREQRAEACLHGATVAEWEGRPASGESRNDRPESDRSIAGSPLPAGFAPELR
jgi:hypothetical protein